MGDLEKIQGLGGKMKHNVLPPLRVGPHCPALYSARPTEPRVKALASARPVARSARRTGAISDGSWVSKSGRKGPRSVADVQNHGGTLQLHRQRSMGRQ